MGDNAASAPAKPGSKLASIQALGQSNIARRSEAPVPAKGEKRPITPPVTPTPVERPAVAKAALAAAEAKPLKARKKPAKDDEPWLKLKISRRTYFNRKKAGKL